MNSTKIFFFIFITIALSLQNSYAQQEPIVKNTLQVKIDNLNFVKNNEYFNHIADGYTLLGTQLHPKLAFFPHPKVQLELGVFSLTYAGLNRYHKIIPTFSFSYKMKDAKFIMGTLQSGKAHNMIAPLLDFESYLDQRSVENGLQYVFKNNVLSLDTWLNWEDFIFKKDPHNEVFVMGLNTSYTPYKKKNWQIDVLFQNTFYHRGGQINTDLLAKRQVFTMRHSALGLQIKRQLSTEQSLKGKSFFIHHQSSGTPGEFIFDKGFGWLSNLTYSYKNWNIGTGYWYGDKFVSPRGESMFQSVSTKTDIHYIDGVLQEVYAQHTEPIRSLILGEVSYQKILVPNLTLAFNFNGYYQNYSSNPTPNNTKNTIKNHFDYAVGLTIQYSGKLKLL